LITFRGQFLQFDWTATIVAEVQVIDVTSPDYFRVARIVRLLQTSPWPRWPRSAYTP